MSGRGDYLDRILERDRVVPEPRLGARAERRTASLSVQDPFAEASERTPEAAVQPTPPSAPSIPRVDPQDEPVPAEHTSSADTRLARRSAVDATPTRPVEPPRVPITPTGAVVSVGDSQEPDEPLPTQESVSADSLTAAMAAAGRAERAAERADRAAQSMTTRPATAEPAKVSTRLEPMRHADTLTVDSSRKRSVALPEEAKAESVNGGDAVRALSSRDRVGTRPRLAPGEPKPRPHVLLDAAHQQAAPADTRAPATAITPVVESVDVPPMRSADPIITIGSVRVEIVSPPAATPRAQASARPTASEPRARPAAQAHTRGDAATAPTPRSMLRFGMGQL